MVDGSPGIRFYAGAPIVTASSEVVGVFAVLDTQPKDSFTVANRRKLLDFARLAMIELELVMDERDLNQHRILRTHSQDIPQLLIRPRKQFPPLPSTEERETVRARILQSIEHDARTINRRARTLGPTHPSSLLTPRISKHEKQADTRKSMSTTCSPGGCSDEKLNITNSDGDSPYRTPPFAPFSVPPPKSSSYLRSKLVAPKELSRPTTSYSTIQAIHRERHLSCTKFYEPDTVESQPQDCDRMPMDLRLTKRYDEASFAMSLIARSLGFNLVYLLRVSPIRPDIYDNELAGQGLHTEVVVSYGMPQPEPVFDSALHLRALRSDGGLMYSNQNKVPKDHGCGYQLGILLPLHRDEGFSSCAKAGSRILTIPPPCRGGIVLCAFTRSGGEAFSPEEVRLFREFGAALWDVLFQTRPVSGSG